MVAVGRDRALSSVPVGLKLACRWLVRTPRFEQAGVRHAGSKSKQPHPKHHPGGGAQESGGNKAAHMPMVAVLILANACDVDRDQMGSGVNYGLRRYSVMAMKKTAGPGQPTPGGNRLTIGRLAKAAGVGVETIRYYQSRGLLPVPRAAVGFRQYPISMVDRIGFIKRAQGLGFTLVEVASLLDLEDGRNRRAIQTVTRRRLEQIDEKLGDLARMRTVLRDLLAECESTGHLHPCPIIAALLGPPPAISLRVDRLR